MWYLPALVERAPIRSIRWHPHFQSNAGFEFLSACLVGKTFALSLTCYCESQPTGYIAQLGDGGQQIGFRISRAR